MATILVTGATAGIGREAALFLAGRGHRVFATGRRESALAELEREAGERKLAGALETVVLDITDEASIAAARDEVMRRTEGRGLDVLVNNAGYAALGPVEGVNADELRAQFETNVFGSMAVTRAFVPAMRAAGKGRIVNVSSLAGRVTFPMMGVYHASKYALEALSDALRLELRMFGIDVVLVEPGFVHTSFTERAMNGVERFSDGPYGSVMKKAERQRESFERTGVSALVVVRTLTRAIETTRPRARYLVPRRIAFVLLAFRYLPTAWVDAILRRMFGLPGAPVRALLSVSNNMK